MKGLNGRQLCMQVIVKQIIYNSSVDIQVGGGIRNLKAAETYINAGAYRIILGTVALKEPEFVAKACKEFPGKIIIDVFIYHPKEIYHEVSFYSSALHIFSF